VLTKGFGVRGSQLQRQGDEAGWKREEDERRRAGKQPCTALPVRRTAAHSPGAAAIAMHASCIALLESENPGPY